MTKVLQRKDGRARVRMTVYLPPKVARALRMRAAETGAEMSELVTAALEAMLVQPKHAAPSTPLVPAMAKPSGSASRPSTSGGASALPPGAPALAGPPRRLGATLHRDANPWEGVDVRDPLPAVEDAAHWNLRQIYGYAAHLRKLRPNDESVQRWVDAVVKKREVLAAGTPPGSA
jgi:hypothetical protein